MTNPSLESNNDNEHHDEFTRAIPDPSLYEYYARYSNMGIDSIRRNRQDGVPSYRCCGMFDCQFISLYELQDFFINDLENDNYDDEREIEQAHRCIDAYDRIYRAEKESRLQWNEFYRHADWMQDLFNVDISIFDYKFDRQCEIQRGYLKDAYLVSALRSFAWTLAEYCDRKGVTPGDVSYPIVRRLVDFIAEHDWLNYNGVSYCRGLCDAPDNVVFYAPDGLSDADRSLLPSPPLYYEDNNGPYQVMGNVPAIVRSLDALRRDLAFAYPAIRLLFDELAINRNYFEPLLGDDADLIYAWCGFVFAAWSPFSLERGFIYYKYYFERWADERDDWYKRFGKDLTENPSIVFRDRRFFFCDLDEPYDVTEHPTVQEVVERGGIIQGSVTSLTDYLVVNPPPPHRYYGPPETAPPNPVSHSWIPVACDYRRRGRHIDIVLQRNVEAALEKSPQGAPLDVENHVTDDLDRVTDHATQKGDQSQATYEQNTQLVPSSDLVIDDYGTLLKYKGSEKHIVLPEGIKAIGKEAFKGQRTLESIVLPEGVQEIKPYAFYMNEGIRHITLPSTLRAISKHSFHGCHVLTHVDIPEGIKAIGDYAFMDCYNLCEIRLPSTLRVVSKCSFQGCHALTHVDIPEGIKTIGDYAFTDCYNLREIRLPSTLRKICYRAFYKCSALMRIAIPGGVRSISASAFKLCEQLKSVMFSNGTVPDVPFTFGDSVSSFKLPGRLQRIGKEAFKFCHSLVEIEIPEGIVTIEPKTFEGCVNLVKVTLPNTLRAIGARAFFDCQKLETIVIPDGVEEIGDHAFARCPKLKDNDLPKSVRMIGEKAFVSE